MFPSHHVIKMEMERGKEVLYGPQFKKMWEALYEIRLVGVMERREGLGT
jgi:hypothetical protein